MYDTLALANSALSKEVAAPALWQLLIVVSSSWRGWEGEGVRR